jgi:hypothetical protein
MRGSVRGRQVTGVPTANCTSGIIRCASQCEQVLMFLNPFYKLKQDQV